MPLPVSYTSDEEDDSFCTSWYLNGAWSTRCHLPDGFVPFGKLSQQRKGAAVNESARTWTVLRIEKFVHLGEGPTPKRPLMVDDCSSIFVIILAKLLRLSSERHTIWKGKRVSSKFHDSLSKGRPWLGSLELNETFLSSGVIKQITWWGLLLIYRLILNVFPQRGCIRCSE